MSLRASHHRPLDLERHRQPLSAIVREIEQRLADGSFDVKALDGILRRFPRDGVGFFSRAEIIAGYRALRGLADDGDDAEADADETLFVSSVQRRPIRTQSGVTPLTVLTKPFPCPGKCVFCPNDVRMPKSYLADEPGAQRAAANRFDPYLQSWNRLAAYRAIGHPTDKVELIVLGGTWSFYPLAYQRWFTKRCLDALTDFGAGRDGRNEIEPSAPDFELLPRRIDGRTQSENPYNKMVSGFLSRSQDGELVPAAETASWSELEAAQRSNEEARARCVGLVFETRPDHVSAEEVVRMRRLGATKVQIGVQSLDDKVLELTRRGHDVETTRRALRLLRSAGFKLHVHWMPNLVGATPERDVLDFARLFDDPAIRPDELKVYPCSLIESAELMQIHERGEWQPYSKDELLFVLTAALERVPRWCRVTRVIRDISSDDIVTGNKLTNFRQLAEAEIVRRGGQCRDIRSREIRAGNFDPESLEMRVTCYSSSIGEERFLEFVTPDDRVLGFLRLSLPVRAAEPLSCWDADFGDTAELRSVRDSAMIREVHVYGVALNLGARAASNAQHRGLGSRLVEEAARMAREDGRDSIAVISAIGTRAWYRRLGFVDEPLYQLRKLTPR